MAEKSTVAEAIVLLKNQDFTAAKSVCQELTKQNPDDAQAWHLSGIADAQLGNLQSAAESLRTATKLAWSNANYHFNLALAYKGLDQLDQAEESYREAIQQNNDFREAYINLGSLLVERGKPDDASAILRQALNRFDDASDAHFNLANLLRDQGEFQESIDHYRSAIELSPTFANACENLARLLISQGMIVDAQKVLEDWLVHSPESSMARHMLASISGEDVPARCDDDYVREIFDERFAEKFDEQLANLEYQAPELVANALITQCTGSDELTILDAGCGTGLCAAKLRPIAKVLHGVDLSAAMLKIADIRQLYDQLIETELTEYLRSHPREYDCIISADTLCYFGDLQQVFVASANCLKGSGVFIFTVELQVDEANGDFTLQTNGRYCHTEQYVRESLMSAGLQVQSVESVTLRLERGNPVQGAVVVAELPQTITPKFE